ncbi:MAG TPA: hypothetical protein VEX68_07845 [Bryobacteraceae bacterium]|nr:hypothetical protein [Bryobacteraceae bacterium]
MNHIEEQRDELGRHINELESRVKKSVDWRAQFDRNPMLMMGVAMGGGLLLGAIVNGRSRDDHSWSSSGRNRSFSSPSEYPASSSSYSAPSTLSSQSAAPARESRRRPNDTIEQMKTALIGFATAKAKEFMSEALPGFSHYLDEAGKRHGQRDQFAQTESSGQDYQGSTYQAGAARTEQPRNAPYRQEPS